MRPGCRDCVRHFMLTSTRSLPVFSFPSDFILTLPLQHPIVIFPLSRAAFAGGSSANPNGTTTSHSCLCSPPQTTKLSSPWNPMNAVARSFPVHFRSKGRSSPHSQAAARSITSSAPAAKALPFSLKSYGKDVEEAEHGQHLRMLMFGKPGAGKGTLSTRLTQKYDISFLSTGDLLRQEIAEKSEVGRIAEEIVAHGGLLSDDVMIRVITSKLDLLRDKHWILDGFPRTLGQGELLDSHLRNSGHPLSLIVNLDVPDEVILNRISDRWVHLPSGRVYNLSYNRPRVEGKDNVTGEPLSKRPDDNPEIFARRLKNFYESTSPLISYYASKASPMTKLVTLTGTTSDEIWPKLEEVVNNCFPIKPRAEMRAEIREREREKTIRSAMMKDSLERDRVKNKVTIPTG